MEKKQNNIDLNNEKELASRYGKLFLHLKDYESKLANLEQLKEEISSERYNALYREYSDFINQSKPVLNDLENLLSKKIYDLSEKESLLDNELTIMETSLDQERKMYEAGAISKNEYDNKYKPLNLSKKSLISKKDALSKRISTLQEAKEGNFKRSKEPNPIVEIDDIPKFYKNPSIAVVLSFFFAGLGQIYNGQIFKGVIFIVIYTLSALSMLILIGFVTTPILWIWGMIDAYSSASKVNANLLGT